MISSINKKILFVILGGFLASHVYSRDHINCAVRFSAAPEPMMVCSNQDDEFPVRITHRKMPGWYTNASLKLIEVCEMERVQSDDKDKIIVQQKLDGQQGSLKLESGDVLFENETSPSETKKKETPVLKPIKCHRKFCSQDHSDLKVLINGTPIPAGYVLLKLWVSVRHAKVEIRCEEY
ncbi:hypothetical protein OAK75_14315 [Bacteriovoracales bacterium]|nr:hypothetical protein [Bacteriovoracales bacterium]